jgi:hypothetical protein
MSSAPTTTPQPPAGGPPAAPPAKSGGAKVLLWILGILAGLAVIGIVCVGLIVFFVVHKVKEAGLDPDLMKKNPVLAIAKLSVATNPDMETVSSDDSSGTIVIRDKKTGKVSTMKVDPDSKTMVVTDADGKTVTMKLDSTRNRLVVTDEKGKTATITADQHTGSMEIKSSEGDVKLGGAADKAPEWVPSYPGASNSQNALSSNNANERTGTFAFVTSDRPEKVMSFYGDALKAAGFKVSTVSTNNNDKAGGFVSGQNESQKHTVTVGVSSENDGTHVSATYAEKKQM